MQFDKEANTYQTDYYEARECLKTNDTHMEKLTAAYNECIDDMYSEYLEKAEEVIENFLVELLCIEKEEF